MRTAKVWGARGDARPYRDRYARNDRDAGDDGTGQAWLRSPHVPKDVLALDDAGDVLQAGGLLEVLAGRQVRHALERGLLDAGGELLLRGQIGRVNPGVDAGLHLGHIGPAEPCLVAIGTQRLIGDRRRHVDTVPTGDEHAPTAFVRRILLRAPLNQSAPVHHRVI